MSADLYTAGLPPTSLSSFWLDLVLDCWAWRGSNEKRRCIVVMKGCAAIAFSKAYSSKPLTLVDWYACIWVVVIAQV